MYYKVIKNKRVIDILDNLYYCKYQFKHDILLGCDEMEAQGIYSSDGSTAYHLSTLNAFPVDKFDTVSLEEITEMEYKRLAMYHLQTPEEIAQNVILELMERGAL